MGGTSSKTPGDQPTDDPSQYQPSAIRRSTLGPTIKAVAAFKRRSLVSGLDDQMIPEANPRTESQEQMVMHSQLSLAVLTAEKALDEAEKAAAESTAKTAAEPTADAEASAKADAKAARKELVVAKKPAGAMCAQSLEYGAVVMKDPPRNIFGPGSAISPDMCAEMCLVVVVAAVR